MLNFLKKSGKKEVRTSQNNETKNTIKFEEIDQQILASENFCEFQQSSPQSNTKLSRNLKSILLDKTCICYLVQFLETKHALSLLKFWLDVESFRIASTTCKLEKQTDQNLLPEKSISVENYNDIKDNDSFASYSLSDISPGTNSNHKYNSLTTENNLKFMGEYSNCSNMSLPNIDYFVNKSETTNFNREKSDNISEKSDIYEEEESNNEISSKLKTSIATDAIRIYKKYLLTNSIYYIDIPATILSSISLALCENTNIISPLCFVDAQKFIFERLEKEYLNSFLESIYYCKFTVDVLTSDSLTLNDILYSESVLFYLMEFLEQENKRCYLDFWISATNFQNQIKNIDEHYKHSQTQCDAMVLYEKYFSLQATNSLNMSDMVRYRIEESICKENGTIFNCFELPIRIIEYYLDQNYFHLFLKSQMFYKYLAELFNKIQEHKVLNENEKQNNSAKNVARKKKQHRKTLSDCSSDQTKQIIGNNYVQTQNTLLAMESKSKSNIRSASTSDMVIDSNQLYNPDLLWRRNSVAGLSFGRIDSLGRYEREYEIDTSEDKWSLSFGSNKLKKAVKKLVNLPEENVQEEIAWQVAEMIVRDITNITMNDKIDKT